MIGRVLDCVFNSSKSYVDMLQYNAICKNTDKRLLDLIAKTIGFEVKRQCDTVDLFILCSVFKYILRRKGTMGAVEDCVRVLLKAQNIDKPFYVYDDGTDVETNNKAYNISIYVPSEMADIALLEDMLDYVLPAGYTYVIISTGLNKGGLKDNVAALSDTGDSEDYESSALGRVFMPDDIDISERTDMSVVYRNDDE